MSLIWKCKGCGLPVEDGEGYLECHYADIHRAETERRAWEDEWTPPRGTWKPIPGGALLDYPEHARWLVWHRQCDPQPDANSYWMAIERVRTQGHLLSWTAHLMGKTWLGDTNWDDLVRSQAGVDA